MHIEPIIMIFCLKSHSVLDILVLYYEFNVGIGTLVLSLGPSEENALYAIILLPRLFLPLFYILHHFLAHHGGQRYQPIPSPTDRLRLKLGHRSHPHIRGDHLCGLLGRHQTETPSSTVMSTHHMCEDFFWSAANHGGNSIIKSTVARDYDSAMDEDAANDDDGMKYTGDLGGADED